MLARDRLQVNFYLTGKKALAAKSAFIPPLVIAIFLAYIWVKDSYSMCLKFFIYLFPHIFLFFSQDMAKEEVESGALENVLFFEGKFKSYLWAKNFCLFLIGCGLSAAAMAFLAAYGLAVGEFPGKSFAKFGIGLVAGAYYVALGGFLSFYFKGGSNVLIVILGQLSLFIGLIFSVTTKSGFIDCLANAHFPDWASKLKFFIFLAFFPNTIVSEKHFLYGFVVVGLSCLFLLLQRAKLHSLELKK